MLHNRTSLENVQNHFSEIRVFRILLNVVVFSSSCWGHWCQAMDRLDRSCDNPVPRYPILIDPCALRSGISRLPLPSCLDSCLWKRRREKEVIQSHMILSLLCVLLLQYKRLCADRLEAHVQKVMNHCANRPKDYSPFTFICRSMLQATASIIMCATVISMAYVITT